MRNSWYSLGLPGPRERARTLSFLFFGGGVIGFAAVAFMPLPPGTNVTGTLVTIGISIVTGVVLFIGASAFHAGSRQRRSHSVQR